MTSEPKISDKAIICVLGSVTAAFLVASILAPIILSFRGV